MSLFLKRKTLVYLLLLLLYDWRNSCCELGSAWSVRGVVCVRASSETEKKSGASRSLE